MLRLVGFCRVSLKDPRVIKLLIEILTASDFGELVKNWFNVELPKTPSQFRDDPLIGLLMDLLSADDVRNEVFVGHVGLVIRERGNVYIIERNITSYSHYRVSIHPYYVRVDVDRCGLYLNKKYAEYLTHNDSMKDDTDYALPEAQASGWVNRRAAKLEHIWHARPKSLTKVMQDNLVLAAKALHGRP